MTLLILNLQAGYVGEDVESILYKLLAVRFMFSTFRLQTDIVFELILESSGSSANI